MMLLFLDVCHTVFQMRMLSFLDVYDVVVRWARFLLNVLIFKACYVKQSSEP